MQSPKMPTLQPPTSHLQRPLALYVVCAAAFTTLCSGFQLPSSPRRLINIDDNRPHLSAGLLARHRQPLTMSSSTDPPQKQTKKVPLKDPYEGKVGNLKGGMERSPLNPKLSEAETNLVMEKTSWDPRSEWRQRSMDWAAYENVTSFVCSQCGYVYVNAENEIRFQDLPDNWRCPACNAPKSAFGVGGNPNAFQAQFGIKPRELILYIILPIVGVILFSQWKEFIEPRVF
mmetsp:Transcript_30792/g.76436  ORF Transcript_30792/g.76436 Transcript_30792/m.76436 type:complete len:230 (-) Transcript_30792:122-811(-)